MKYRAALGVIVIGLSLGALAGCHGDDDWDWDSSTDSEIVFGISQSKNAEGKVSTSVGYEFLDVLDNGWSTIGQITKGRSCWAERLDDRLGQPRVEGGVATFQGGALPDKGIAVVANQPDDLVLDAPAWQTGGDALTFEAKGFAMPNIGPATIYAPTIELALVSPALPTDAAPELAIDGKAADPLGIEWTVGEETVGPRETVVAALVVVPEETPTARGVELRCFFDRRAGKGAFPQAMITRFTGLVGGAGNPIKGKLRIATHRQLTIHARGGWTVYVVASVDQREQPFAMTR
jgi:hypothetical protein